MVAVTLLGCSTNDLTAIQHFAYEFNFLLHIHTVCIILLLFSVFDLGLVFFFLALFVYIPVCRLFSKGIGN